jgi:hypothetical protein
MHDLLSFCRPRNRATKATDDRSYDLRHAAFLDLGKHQQRARTDTPHRKIGVVRLSMQNNTIIMAGWLVQL